MVIYSLDIMPTKKEVKKWNKDLVKAIDWAAAEWWHVRILKGHLSVIEGKNDINKEVKEIKNAIKVLKYVGKAERRAAKFEEEVEMDLKKLYKELSTHLGFDFSFKHELMKMIREIGIEHDALVKYTSIYEGLLKEELTKAEAEAQLLADLKGEHSSKKAEKIHTSLLDMIHKIQKEVEDVEKWVAALEVSLKNTEKIIAKLPRSQIDANIKNTPGEAKRVLESLGDPARYPIERFLKVRRKFNQNIKGESEFDKLLMKTFDLRHIRGHIFDYQKTLQDFTDNESKNIHIRMLKLLNELFGKNPHYISIPENSEIIFPYKNVNKLFMDIIDCFIKSNDKVIFNIGYDQDKRISHDLNQMSNKKIKQIVKNIIESFPEEMRHQDVGSIYLENGDKEDTVRIFFIPHKIKLIFRGGIKPELNQFLEWAKFFKNKGYLVHASAGQGVPIPRFI